MRGLEGFAADAEEQARYFEARGVHVYARLARDLGRLADTDALVRSALEEAWNGRDFFATYERPLLLLASIRMDALAGSTHPLARALAVEPDETALGDDAIRASLEPGRAARTSLRTRFVQTNEVSRAIAWRLPLEPWANERDVVLVDIGCSAGLNLVADRLDFTWTDATGTALSLVPTYGVVCRVGFDRAPVDVRDPAERAFLRACLWPGQRERDQRLLRAMDEAARALDRGEIVLEQAAAEAMAERIERIAQGRRVLAFQTVFLAYLTDVARAAYHGAMADLVARHVGRVMWVELEAAPKGRPGPAEIRVHSAGGTRVLASCEYHPRQLSLCGA